MEKLIENMEAEFAALKQDAAKLQKGNKSAAARLRKAAMNISKDCKAIRQEASDFKNNL